jgi:spermidine synthase
MGQAGTSRHLPTELQQGVIRIGRLLPFLYLLSGATSLVFETVFTRLLTYTFGNTAYAVSTVLGVFLGGLALGAFLIGRWSDRRPPSLRVYAWLELLTGVYCFFAPDVLNLVTQVYVALYHAHPLAGAGLTALRLAIAGPVILPPTVLMGATLPVLARYVTATGTGIGVDRLYAWNTLGAALGALGSAYLLMPSLGLRGTLVVAGGVNLAIFVTIVRLAPSAAPTPSLPTPEAPPGASTSRWTALLLAGAFLAGAIALAYEVVWTHILAFLIGNTVYAFGAMLFVILCGLGWGAQFVSRRVSTPERWAKALGISQVLLGTTVLATLPLWNRIPGLFSYGVTGAYNFDLVGVAVLALAVVGYLAWRTGRSRAASRGDWIRKNEHLVIGLGFCVLVVTGRVFIRTSPEMAYFVIAELLRLLCAFFMLIAPALLAGLGFPLLLNLFCLRRSGAASSVGRIYAANTVGAVLGSLGAGFVVLPSLGSVGTLRALAASSGVLGMVCRVARLARRTV